MKWINAGMASLFATVAALNGYLVGTFWEDERGRAWLYVGITAMWAISAGVWALTNWYQGSIYAMDRAREKTYR